ncbi:MAG: ABC transporter permease [Granulosicoccus sp.]
MTLTLRNLITGKNSRQGLWLLPLLITLIGFVWLYLRNDQFGNSENLSNIVAKMIPLLATSIGQMLVILTGGMDLSVGSVISLTTAILSLDAPSFMLIPAVFAAAALVGLVNGIAITRFRVVPIIATLSTMMIVLGVTRLIRPVAGGEVPQVIVHLVTGSFSGVYMPILWLIVLVGFSLKLIHGSRFGLHLFAIGGGVMEDRAYAARNFGVPDTRQIISAYVACSLFAALAGIYLAGRISSGDPNVGLNFHLDSITAVALGGTQLAGGVGSLWGTLIGSFSMTLLANGMNIENVSAFIQTVVKGVLLMLVVALQSRKKMGL